MTIPISAGLKAHLALPGQTITWCLKVTWTDGTVLGYTALDADLDFDGVTYESVVGFQPFDVVTGSDLSVDNSQIKGILSAPSITVEDMRAGKWDGAMIEFFAVNFKDLSQGALVLRVGWLGTISIGRNDFEAELRGSAQSYTRVMGQLTGPMCRNTLGDAGCQVDLAPFTFTTTVDSVVDNQVIQAAALNQAGGGTPVAISSISKANPGVVSMAGPLPGATSGGPVMIYGCTGMVQVNGSTFYRNPSGNTFQLAVNTTAYPTYTGGGMVEVLGGASGYFDGGVILFNTGLNAGLRMDIRSSAPGQIILQLPMYQAIAAGDSITVTAGCNRSLSTCKTKFVNVVNFNGEPYLPGVDKIVQVGKQ